MSTGNRLDVVEVGGASVLHPFTSGTIRYKRGDRLTREEVLKIPSATREALINTNRMREFLLPPGSFTQGAVDTGTRFVVRRTDDPKMYDVVVGHRMNSEPLARDTAEKLAKDGLT